MSLRRFTALINGLPPGNALERARHGRWSDLEVLLHDISSRVRELVAITYNIHRGDRPAAEVTYLERPRTADDIAQQAAQDAYDDLMQRQLEEL